MSSQRPERQAATSPLEYRGGVLPHVNLLHDLMTMLANHATSALQARDVLTSCQSSL
jgi:hypothetical protein